MIDDAIDRLVAAYRGAGLPPIRPAQRGVKKTLAAIADAIHPMRLPADLETFWRRVDPTSITVAPYPKPDSAEYSLDLWQRHRTEFPGMTPASLFPVCYQEHGFLFVELAGDEWDGDVCVYWAYGGSDFHVRHANLAGYLDLLATMIELGERDFMDDREWEDTCAVRLAASLPLGPYGHTSWYSDDLRGWPEHWLRSTGLTPEKRTPRGTTATVADLLARAVSGGETSATIRGRVTSLAKTSGGARVVVDDGTGALDLWCPDAVSAYGPVIRREFEFDVVVRGRPSDPPDIDPEHREIQRRMLGYDLAGAQAAARDLYAKAFGSPAAAEATAIRPLD